MSSINRKYKVLFVILIIVLLVVVLVAVGQFSFDTVFCIYSYELCPDSIRVDETLQCPNAFNRILTVSSDGRLGNKIWEYMSLLAFQKIYFLNGTIFFRSGMKNQLQEVFDGIDDPIISDIPESCIRGAYTKKIGLMENPKSFNFSQNNLIVVLHDYSCRYTDVLNYSLENIKKKLRIDDPIISDIPESCIRGAYTKKIGLMENPKSFNFSQNNLIVVLHDYSCRYTDVLNYSLENIKKKLRFHQKWIDKGTQVLTNIKANLGFNDTDTVTFIGVHYRGGDYNFALTNVYSQKFEDPPSFLYYKNAMEHFENTTKNPIFVFSTIDKNWAAKNLRYLDNFNIFKLHPVGVVEDLVTLSLCNHSIINYGTYGTTAALFANGRTFVYDLKLPNDGRGYTLACNMAKVIPNWFLCDNNSPCNAE